MDEETVFDWETCGCFELGHQICSHYENWCSEQESKEWWESLNQEEKDSYYIRLCNNCSRTFEDGDLEKDVCPDCVDWLDVYDEYGVNF